MSVSVLPCAVELGTRFVGQFSFCHCCCYELIKKCARSDLTIPIRWTAPALPPPRKRNPSAAATTARPPERIVLLPCQPPPRHHLPQPSTTATPPPSTDRNHSPTPPRHHATGKQPTEKPLQIRHSLLPFPFGVMWDNIWIYNEARYCYPTYTRY
jgi:hypothetical protein